jgi:hypothetical protein
VSKLNDRLNAWASLKCELGDLRKKRRELECSDPHTKDSHDGYDHYTVEVPCRLDDWPKTFVPICGDHDRMHFDPCDFEGPPCSPEEAIDDVDEWCPECVKWLLLLIEERKLRKRVGGLTSALLRQWKAEAKP